MRSVRAFWTQIVPAALWVALWLLVAGPGLASGAAPVLSDRIEFDRGFGITLASPAVMAEEMPGRYWVVGPVTVTAGPAGSRPGFSGASRGLVRRGSQGIDARMMPARFDAEAALSYPSRLEVGDVVVFGRSRASIPGKPAGKMPQVSDYFVLEVVASPPVVPPGHVRFGKPPVAGTTRAYPADGWIVNVGAMVDQIARSQTYQTNVSRKLPVRVAIDRIQRQNPLVSITDRDGVVREASEGYEAFCAANFLSHPDKRSGYGQFIGDTAVMAMMHLHDTASSREEKIALLTGLIRQGLDWNLPRWYDLPHTDNAGGGHKSYQITTLPYAAMALGDRQMFEQYPLRVRDNLEQVAIITPDLLRKFAPHDNLAWPHASRLRKIVEVDHAGRRIRVESNRRNPLLGDPRWLSFGWLAVMSPDGTPLARVTSADRIDAGAGVSGWFPVDTTRALSPGQSVWFADPYYPPKVGQPIWSINGFAEGGVRPRSDQGPTIGLSGLSPSKQPQYLSGMQNSSTTYGILATLMVAKMTGWSTPAYDANIRFWKVVNKPNLPGREPYDFRDHVREFFPAPEVAPLPGYTVKRGDWYDIVAPRLFPNYNYNEGY